MFASINLLCNFTSTNNNMKNTAQSLENKQILVVNATTIVNRKSKKSRICNKTISLGSIKKTYVSTGINCPDSYSTEFNIIVIDGKDFKPVLYNNELTFYAQDNRTKNIEIEEFKIV